MDQKPDWRHFVYADPVTSQLFQERFEVVLGNDYPRAQELFLRYGPMCSFKFCNLLWLASQKGNVGDALRYLEAYWQQWLETARDEHHREQIFSRATGIIMQGLFWELFRPYGDPAEGDRAAHLYPDSASLRLMMAANQSKPHPG